LKSVGCVSACVKRPLGLAASVGFSPLLGSLSYHHPILFPLEILCHQDAIGCQQDRRSKRHEPLPSPLTSSISINDSSECDVLATRSSHHRNGGGHCRRYAVLPCKRSFGLLACVATNASLTFCFTSYYSAADSPIKDYGPYPKIPRCLW
jgi:hypothetical protein